MWWKRCNVCPEQPTDTERTEKTLPEEQACLSAPFGRTLHHTRTEKSSLASLASITSEAVVQRQHSLDFALYCERTHFHPTTSHAVPSENPPEHPRGKQRTRTTAPYAPIWLDLYHTQLAVTHPHNSSVLHT